jgi:hypothetical protein
MRAAILLLLLLSCRDPEPFARVRRIEAVDHAIGGPVASARAGDFLLENDRIRVVIEQSAKSRTPLGVGGTVIDADVVRSEERYRRGNGLDQLGQIAPTANLYLPGAVGPGAVVVSGTESGAVEVTAKAGGVPIQDILAALNLLLDRRFLSGSGDYAKLALYTEYELRPGEAVLRITTTVGFDVPFCPPQPGDGCNEACDDILYDDDCACDVPSRCTAVELRTADALPDRPMPAGISDILLGDLPRPIGGGRCTGDAECGGDGRCTRVIAPLGGDFSVCRSPDQRDAGVLIGDMLLFGAHLSPFLPGIGYDTESDIRRLFDAGEDTLSIPLETELVLAIGDGVSYGYAPLEGRVLIPIFGGPFSLGASGAASCKTSEPGCLHRTLIRSQRLFSVGRGDASSALRPLLAAQGRAAGRLSGVVLDSDRRPVSGADVFLIEATPGITDPTLAALLEANRARTVSPVFLTGVPGVASHAKTDPRGDAQRDGRFEMWAAPGDYFAVAFTGDRAQSAPVPVTIRADREAETLLALPRTSRLSYSIFDNTGRPLAGRISVISAAQGGLRPLSLGGHRIADGVIAVDHTSSGRGSIELAPGDYEVVASHGPHWSIDRQPVRSIAGAEALISATLVRQVDRTGWTTSDFHVHAQPSLDSSSPIEGRITSFLAEDMDRLSSSDHDILSRYQPYIKKLGLADRLSSQVGVETTTMELGHFIAFPLEYREREEGELLLGYGAPDWRGLTPRQIFDSLRELEDETPVFIDVPHPYTYLDAYGVDPFTMEPTASIVSLFVPLVAPENFDGTFDGMELLNSKGLDLVRRATAGEVRFYSEGLDRLIADRDAGRLSHAAFELAVYDLSTEATRRMLHRTEAEQRALRDGVGRNVECRCGSNGDCAAGLVCDQATLACVEPSQTSTTAPRAPDVAVCRTVRGVVDDWFDMLNHGVFRVGVGGSDVHDEIGGYAEPGSPRVLVRTGATDPALLSTPDFIAALASGRAVMTNGPMIHLTVGGAEVGDTTIAREVLVRLRVEAADWYDVDRVELYRNGELIRGWDPIRRGIVIIDESFVDRPDRDAWYSAIALGLRGRSLAPVYSSAVLARFGTRELIQRIYDIVPRLRGLRLPRNPSLYPTFPLAITNPIFVDLDGDGWDPPLPPLGWCVPGRDFGCSR